MFMPCFVELVNTCCCLNFACTVGSHFAMVRFSMIHLHDPCQVGPSTPNLSCISVTTQVSFLYL